MLLEGEGEMEELFFNGMAISKRLEAVAQVGIESPSVELPVALVPSDVHATLAMYLLDWDELGGNLQRLLLWDAGYVLANSSHLARIYTKCGMTMDDIVVTRDEYEQLGCGIADCNGTAQSTEGCPDSMAEQAAKCATSGVNIISGGPLWAEEGENADVPTPQVFRHSPRTFAIHFATPTNDPASSKDGSASCQTEPRLVIPCTTTFPVSGNEAWCTPASTGTVPALLLDLGAKKLASGSIPVVLWILGALLVTLVLLLSVFAFRKVRRPRREQVSTRAVLEFVKEH